MRVLITGATGFIGKSILAQLIARGFEVQAITRHIDSEKIALGGVDWLQGDLSSLSVLKARIKLFNPEKVIHLGWQGIPDYGQEISFLNLKNSIEFLSFVLVELPCTTAILAGSSFEYGFLRGECKESDVGVSNTYFSWAKQSLATWLELKCRETGKNFVWYRIFFAYGPGQRSESLIPTLVRAFRFGHRPSIMNPFNKNDFIYIDDVAEAFLLAIQTNVPAGIYNLGSGVPTSVYEVCRLVEETLAGKSDVSDQIRSESKATEQSSFWANMARTKSVLRWAPRFSIEEGISAYIDSLNTPSRNRV